MAHFFPFYAHCKQLGKNNLKKHKIINFSFLKCVSHALTNKFCARSYFASIYFCALTPLTHFYFRLLLYVYVYFCRTCVHLDMYIIPPEYILTYLVGVYAATTHWSFRAQFCVSSF